MIDMAETRQQRLVPKHHRLAPHRRRVVSKYYLGQNEELTPSNMYHVKNVNSLLSNVQLEVII